MEIGPSPSMPEAFLAKRRDVVYRDPRVSERGLIPTGVIARSAVAVQPARERGSQAPQAILARG